MWFALSADIKYRPFGGTQNFLCLLSAADEPVTHPTNRVGSFAYRFPFTILHGVQALGRFCHTNTNSQGTGSGLSLKHKESRHWVRPVTQTQRVKVLGPACHTNTESQATGSGLSHKHRESKHWPDWSILQRVKALGLAYHTNAGNQPDTGLDLSYKHIVEAPGRPCHTSVDYVNCQ